MNRLIYLPLFLLDAHSATYLDSLTHKVAAPIPFNIAVII